MKFFGVPTSTNFGLWTPELLVESDCIDPIVYLHSIEVIHGRLRLGMKCTIVIVIGAIVAALIVNFSSWYFNQPSTMWNTEYKRFKYKLYGSLKGNIIMLIPGLDGATSFFSDSIPELTAQGYSVLVMSIPLYLGGNNYTFEYLASEIISVLSELSIDNVDCIVGESFGGVITQYIALNYPNKVKSIVLLSSLAKTNVPYNVEWKITYLLPILKFVGIMSPGFAQSLFARLHCEDVVEKAEDITIRDLFIKEASVAHFASVMERIKIVYKLDIRERIKHGIAMPTLILYGDIDSFTKPGSLMLHSLVNNSKLEALPGGHLPHISKPKLFSEKIVSFLHDNNGMQT